VCHTRDEVNSSELVHVYIGKCKGDNLLPIRIHVIALADGTNIEAQPGHN
jgi:hypothetical protein